jgi:uncharacterized protein YtpQ (UPF0354 family)
MVGVSFMPLLVAAGPDRGASSEIRDGFLGGMEVAYSFGPPYGERFVTHADLDRLGLDRRQLHRFAAANLQAATERVRLVGQPPALMVSFDGIESSALLDADFWEDLRDTVPGELVVGVPARDVVIVTGSGSRQGMEKARRAVDRVFFAGGNHLLSQDLLVWRRRAWEILRPAVSSPGTRRPSGLPR